jgi:hypothetical protein
MAKKPDAARGKTTRIGKIKKIIKGIKAKPKTVGMGMSPGAMGGRTTPRRGLKRAPESRFTPRRKGLTDLMKKTALKGAGASGTAMAGQAMKLARQLKKTGRLSVDDLMRAKKMMMGRKGK